MSVAMYSRRVLWVIMVVLVSFSCDHDKPVGHDIAYFKEHLDVGMDHQSIIRYFGAADADFGSGIHMYLYGLEDGTSVIIGASDKLIYARHVDQRGNLLETLI